MATTRSSDNGGDNGEKDIKKIHENENIKCMCYSEEQVAIFEQMYAQCPHPSASQRQQMKRDNDALKDIEDQQIKVWFQNRRDRDKQRKDNSDRQLLREKLIAANNILMEENDSLKKKVSELLHENDYLRRNYRTYVKKF